jgi:membrane protein YdbS with pleckstrin-like domain
MKLLKLYIIALILLIIATTFLLLNFLQTQSVMSFVSLITMSVSVIVFTIVIIFRYFKAKKHSKE